MTNHTTRTLRQAKRLTMRELDKLWAELVKKRDGYRCQALFSDCNGGLDAHHFVTKKNKSVRYLLLNGVTLCRKHHDMAHKFSDEEIIKSAIPKEQAEELQAAARTLSKTGKAYMEFWHEYLLTEKGKLG